jgi:hypothetical protein
MGTSERRRGDSRIAIFEFSFLFFYFSFIKTGLIRFIFRKATFIPTTPNMSQSSTTTSYATATVPTVPTNYLNTEVHVGYNESLHSIQEQRRAMLLAMNHLAHVREMARTINAAGTNAANAMLSITPTIKILLGSDFVASHNLQTATDDLVEIVRTETEQTIYNLTKQIAFKLKATPEAGTDEEIKSARIIVDAYIKDERNPPTRPNTPLPIPMPAGRNFEEEYENINFIAEVDNLLIFMNHVPPVKKTTLFKPPEKFATIVEGGEKDMDLWEEILETLFNSKAAETKYSGRTVFYYQFGSPHAPHFMGRNWRDKYIIAASKKDLFNGMGI